MQFADGILSWDVLNCDLIKAPRGLFYFNKICYIDNAPVSASFNNFPLLFGINF